MEVGVPKYPTKFRLLLSAPSLTRHAILCFAQSLNLFLICRPTAKVEPTIRTDDGAGISRKPNHHAEFDESLSSLSIESEDDGGNLLSQTIAAGANKPKQEAHSNPINIPIKPRSSVELCNESISSVDSAGKDDAANSILEQCIRSGINKVVKKESSKSRDRLLVTSSPKKSMLPTLSNKPGSSKKPDKKVQDKKDEELLQECINSGILKNTRNDQLAQNFSKLSMSEPKNAESTSVIALDNRQCAFTITGVEAKAEESSNTTTHPARSAESSSFRSNESRDHDERAASRSQPSRPANWTTPNGSSTSFELNLSVGSVDENILERSNEYPAAKLSMGAYGDLDDDSIMEMSNEFMMENERMAEAKIEDKHKDPDLMMKSVDRLTQELVSTAEYLRKNAGNTISDELSEQKMSGSTSNNNTWNDENSFPSISMSAPMIGSTNDEATIATDQIYPMPEEKMGENHQQLDDKTPTNENYTFDVESDEADGPLPKIEFKVGGEIGAAAVNKINFLSYGPTSIETCSTMSNSTIVQVEAKRIANKLTSMTNRLMDSTNSLDLENVRPPSSMDCISLNSYQDVSVQQSPMKQKKSLMSGFVAKRALGHQMFSASAESVNSVLNIDSIRPPSIMDELLDSMISVDSIVSEVVDPTFAISNYETAMSDMEDSLTLRSCMDLSKDETLTGTSSDFSSVESTPKKKRNPRSVTPKQKRQADKDRYKTYTIQVDMLLKEQQLENSGTESMRRSLNARQRRQEDRQRFETQVISHSPTRNHRRQDEPERFKTFKIESALEAEADDDLSIRAMTANFEFIRNGKIPSSTSNFDTNDIRMKLNRIKSGGSSTSANRQTDSSLEYERQNSETESQRDLKNSLNYDANSSVEQEEPTPVQTPSPQEPVRVKSAKTSYISPYRMTTRLTPMKNKAVKVTKTPVIAKIVTKNPTLDLKSSNGTQRGTGAKGRGAKIAVPVRTTNIPKPATTPTQLKEPPTLPIRQGTFIQDEPTLDNVPVVNDLPQTPAKATVSKLKQPTRVISASKVPTTPTEKNPSPKKASNLPTSISQLKYRSNSNASMKSPVIAPVRSNTGINLINPKKIVTSKIAGIWKAADKKDSSIKKPISTSSTQLNGVSKLSTPTSANGRKIVNNTSKERIKRSSTCDEIGKLTMVSG